jgi:hypothetical protein
MEAGLDHLDISKSNSGFANMAFFTVESLGSLREFKIGDQNESYRTMGHVPNNHNCISKGEK